MCAGRRPPSRRSWKGSCAGRRRWRGSTTSHASRPRCCRWPTSSASCRAAPVTCIPRSCPTRRRAWSACAEIRDPAARRYRYPFTNCTHCGPRLSIIEAIPYDRANTTMRAFGLCAACLAEYGDPSDRRFHAQPIACPACGPRLWQTCGNDPVAEARRLLLSGHVIAIKGLGGFQIACDATDEGRSPACAARSTARENRSR